MTWAAYLRTAGFSEDKAIWINIDETAIPFHVGGRAGNRLQAPTRKARAYMAERASLQLKRANCTFMAALATDPEVQKGLPQVLLPKMKGHKKNGITRQRYWRSHTELKLWTTRTVGAQ